MSYYAWFHTYEISISGIYAIDISVHIIFLKMSLNNLHKKLEYLKRIFEPIFLFRIKVNCNYRILGFVF